MSVTTGRRKRVAVKWTPELLKLAIQLYESAGSAAAAAATGATPNAIRTLMSNINKSLPEGFTRVRSGGARGPNSSAHRLSKETAAALVISARGLDDAEYLNQEY